MLIAGNWKMFKGPAEAGAFCRALREADLGDRRRRRLPAVRVTRRGGRALAGTEIAVAAQNVHWADEGAFTGEVSAPMLRELGVYGTIVGHSERRQYFGETDATAARRANAAIEHGLHVIACVGETEAEREAGETEAVLRRQVAAIAEGVADTEDLVLAYEPVWAIGTGRTATAEIAQEAHAFIKAMLPVPVLYGGSVKPENTAELAAQPDVDGALVGGASARSGIVRRDLPRSVPLVALVILDGWGCAPPGPGNAVALADTPVFDRLWQRYPHTTLDASGEAAGLPAGQMGNSEVGHLTIGSGRRLLQDLQRVNSAIADGSLVRSPVLARRRSSVGGASTCSGSSPRAASTRTSTISARCSSSHPTGPGSMPSPTAATSRRTRRSPTSRRCRRTASRP